MCVFGSLSTKRSFPYDVNLYIITQIGINKAKSNEIDREKCIKMKTQTDKGVSYIDVIDIIISR